MRHRGLLHLSKLDDFAAWAESSGFEREPTKGDFEVLRLRPPAIEGRVSPPITFFVKASAEHVTAFDAGLKLVRRWIRERKAASS